MDGEEESRWLLVNESVRRRNERRRKEKKKDFLGFFSGQKSSENLLLKERCIKANFLRNMHGEWTVRKQSRIL